MKPSVTFVCTLLAACSASHGFDADAGGPLGDGGADVTRDAAVMDGLAPRCAEIPATPCLELASTTTFRTSEAPDVLTRWERGA